MTSISKKKWFYFCNRLFIYFTIIKTFYLFWILIFLIYRQGFKMFIFSTTVSFAERKYRWRFVSQYLTSFKEMSCLVAHQIYKGYSSWIKKVGTSDSATNAEKRFKCEKTRMDFQRKMVRRSSLVKIWPWWKCHDMYNMYKVW